MNLELVETGRDLVNLRGIEVVDVNRPIWGNGDAAARADAILLLLFCLLHTGQVKLRKIDGWQEMARGQEAA